MRERRPLLASPAFLRVWLISLAAASGGFLLFPTAPLRLRELGASTAAAGLFLTALTVGSATSAAWTGALGDLLGRRRVLTTAGLGLAALSAVYALLESWWLLVALGLVHGVVWSALLTAASAEATSQVPRERRAEGIAWHGLASTLAVVVAPAAGFWALERGWNLLCAALVTLYLAVAALARALPRTPRPPRGWWRGLSPRGAVDWITLRRSAVLCAVSFGYGGVTSFVAIYAEQREIRPKGIFFTAFALSILALRPALGPYIDRIGARKMLAPSIALVAAGLALVPLQHDAVGLALVALVFGAGFSTLYPAFSTLILTHVPAARHGAAFGAMLAAFDVGIGSGSLAFGALVSRFGAGAAFLTGAAVAAAAWPLHLLLEPKGESRKW